MDIQEREPLAASGPVQPPAGWYDDPAGDLAWRYWTGERWTDELSPKPAQVVIAFAPWWRRAVAVGLDIFALTLTLGLLMSTAVAFGVSNADVIAVGGAFVGFPAYFGVQERLYGQTLGKRLLRIRVVTVDGERLGWGRAVGRQLARIVDNFVLGLGWWWPAFDAMNQAWHDKLAGTLVVVTKKARPASAASGAKAPAPEVESLARSGPPQPAPSVADARAAVARELETQRGALGDSIAPSPPDVAQWPAPTTLQAPIDVDTAPASESNGPAVAKKPRRWRPGRRVLRVAGVVIGLVLVVVGDWYAKNLEFRQVVEATEATEAVTEGWIRWRIEALDVDVARMSQAEYQNYLDSFRAGASRHLADLIAADAVLADAGGLPWHRDIATARERMLEHNEFWARQLRALAAEPTIDPGLAGDIGGTFQIAHRAFERATPAFPLYQLDARVDAIFAE